MKNDVIEELLADLISKCEGRMTSPFHKKAESITAVLEPADEDAETEVKAATDEPPTDDDDEMDSETLQKLIEAYKKSR